MACIAGCFVRCSQGFWVFGVFSTQEDGIFLSQYGSSERQLYLQADPNSNRSLLLYLQTVTGSLHNPLPTGTILMAQCILTPSSLRPVVNMLMPD